jgi:hypothetical protein
MGYRDNPRASARTWSASSGAVFGRMQAATNAETPVVAVAYQMCYHDVKKRVPAVECDLRRKRRQSAQWSGGRGGAVNRFLIVLDGELAVPCTRNPL